MKIYHLADKKKIIAAFKEHQVLIIPTDTIYGFACTIDNLAGKKRIYELKQRSEKMYLSLVVDSLRTAKKLIKINKNDLKYFKSKNSITIIGEIYAGVNEQYHLTFDNTIAVRITKWKWLKQILKKTGPIFATSVNITGQRYGKELNDFKEFAVDVIVDNGYLDNQPSKIYNALTREFVR
ncbi:L-threonylcarbamoyladenylate synthase [Spiroplasma sp. DGKH1]|uniref:L-threonylcarbamoyladenylate synthase n=1 Tax=Spiroplasma sp. DGKH1 TaxID=3050074 RepID=UPI0034C5DD36